MDSSEEALARDLGVILNWDIILWQSSENETADE